MCLSFWFSIFIFFMSDVTTWIVHGDRYFWYFTFHIIWKGLCLIQILKNCDTICFCVYSQPIIAKEWCSDKVREGDAANTKLTFQIAEWNKVNVYMNSCSFHQCMILPCRHMLRLKEVKQADLCSAEAISESWKVSTVRTSHRFLEKTLVIWKTCVSFVSPFWTIKSAWTKLYCEWFS